MQERKRKRKQNSILGQCTSHAKKKFQVLILPSFISHINCFFLACPLLLPSFVTSSQSFNVVTDFSGGLNHQHFVNSCIELVQF